MKSTMQDFPLTVTHLLRHGATVHRRSQVLTFDGEDVRAATFAEVAGRVERLAAALRRLGVGPGDRVGTFMWNTQEHLEAYFAVPCMGAVLHTLNLRLPPSQLVHIVNSASDKVILVHCSAVPILARVADRLTTVERYVIVDDAGSGAAGSGAAGDDWSVFGEPLDYEQLLGAEPAGAAWPELDERQAASMCFTSGTTGDPKGVVYSHRSTFLHTLGVTNGGVLPANERDKVMVIVPMFHVNAWGYPYAAWMVGADLVMPSRFLQGAPLARLIAVARPTQSAGVPTIWNELLRHLETDPGADISSLKMVTGGGSAVPASMIEAYGRLGIRMLQGWGMTETSPVCAVSEPPAEFDPDDVAWRARTGRIMPGVEMRIIDSDGAEAAWDGETVGEIEVRGPWITGSYFEDPAPEKFRDGWLRTGDVGHLDDHGFLTITDRVKDVIKSGGEWISSVELENTLMAHADVTEASVVGVPDDKWGERPLAVVVRRPGAEVSAGDLHTWLSDRVVRWWLPERWTFVDDVPKTSVGKFDKKVIRAREAAGDLEIVRLDG
ncbi:MAG TPA: long-chain fatty acid--CoA ligase [Acidimicrobiales bacterium]|nr:long-chain fatty acid--CoA ligase [Acidimicrobiales bacterium]